MKNRLSTPSRSCSKTASRRSSPVRHGLCALALLLVAPAMLCAQGLELTLSGAGGPPSAHLSFHWNQPATLIQSLKSGLESSIGFTFRLYELRRTPWPFRGDRLVMQKTVTRTAYWDPLDGTFVVEQDDGTRRAYPDGAALLDAFFTVSQVLLSPTSSVRGRSLYTMARAQFEPVRLMPPLTLVSMVGATGSVATPWIRKDLP